MSFYSEMAATAADMLAEFGQVMQLGVPFTGNYNPASATSSLTFVDHPVTGAAFAYPQKDIDGSLVKAGDVKVYLSMRGLDVVPTTTQKLSIGGVPHTIIAVEPLSPAGTVVIYTLQVRR